MLMSARFKLHEDLLWRFRKNQIAEENKGLTLYFQTSIVFQAFVL